jgi:DNA polymerase-4
MAGDAAAWLERRGLFARTVVIKVRYSDFETITRSHSAEPTREPAAIVERAQALLEKTDAGRRPVRLLGASVHNLSDTETPAARPATRRGPRLPFDDEVP